MKKNENFAKFLRDLLKNAFFPPPIATNLDLLYNEAINSAIAELMAILREKRSVCEGSESSAIAELIALLREKRSVCEGSESSAVAELIALLHSSSLFYERTTEL